MQHLLSVLQGLFHAVSKAAKLQEDYPEMLQVANMQRRLLKPANLHLPLLLLQKILPWC